jgi:hypothetical protein
MDIADEAHIGIVLEEPRGSKDPEVLAKVLHSKKFLAKAAARNVEIPNLDSKQEEGDESEGELDVARVPKKKGSQVKAPSAQNRKRNNQRDDDESDDNEHLGRKQKVRPPPQKKPKKDEVGSDEDEFTESDVPPPPSPKKTKKAKPIRNEETTSNPPPPRPKNIQSAPRPALKAKPRSEVDREELPIRTTKPSKKAGKHVSGEDHPQAGPSKLPEERPIAPRPRPRPKEVPSKAKLVIYSSSEEEEEERPRKRARVVTHATDKQSSRASRRETHAGAGTKRKRGGN